MLIAVILLGICQIAALFSSVYLVRRYVEAKQAQFEAKLADLVTPPSEGKPSKLSLIVDAAGTVIGSAAARSLMATLQQRNSSVAQVANGQADLLQAQANPLLALLSGGKRGKGAAVQRLAELLGPMLFGGQGIKSNGAGASPVSISDRRESD